MQSFNFDEKLKVRTRKRVACDNINIMLQYIDNLIHRYIRLSRIAFETSYFIFVSKMSLQSGNAGLGSLPMIVENEQLSGAICQHLLLATSQIRTFCNDQLCLVRHSSFFGYIGMFYEFVEKFFVQNFRFTFKSKLFVRLLYHFRESFLYSIVFQLDLFYTSITVTYVIPRQLVIFFFDAGAFVEFCYMQAVSY